MLYSENYSSSMDREYHTTMGHNALKNIYFSAPTSSTEPGKMLKEIIDRAGGGIQNIEIGQLGAQKWEAIPRQHFEMARQTAKLTMGDKAVVSVHAPIDVDPTGFKQNKWSEEQRSDGEEFMKDVIDKAQLVQTDKKRSVPIAFHASGQVGTSWKWDKKKERLVPDIAMAVVPHTGEMMALKTEERTYPDGRKVKYVPYKERGEELPENTASSFEMAKQNIWEGEQEKISSLWKEQQEAINRLKDIQRERDAGDMTELQANQEGARWAERHRLLTKHLDSAITNTYDKIAQTDEKAREFIDEKANILVDRGLDRDAAVASIMSGMGVPQELGGFGRKTTPEMIKLADEFGKEQAAKTLSNLAKYSYEKYGEYGPQLAVENWDPHQIMGRGKDLKEGLAQARELFVRDLVENKKLPTKKAKEVANRLIGATWDIAHINMMKKFGVPPTKTTKEAWDKYLKREVEEIQDDIRHIHISDNFGYSDVHLAPGMGNVPIKEFLEHMEKTGKLKDVTSVLESAGTAIHLGIPPVHTEALQHFGVASPAWSTSPNWYEVSQNYFFGGSNYASAGFGNILPQGHFSEYGAGFSQLPTATGGMRPGQQSKFSNTPMS